MATRSWNRVELIGNLTRDPELRYTPTGTAVTTFSIATNRTYVSDGEKKEDVDFHRLVAWSKLAELCNQLLKKGNRVFVSGRLQNRSWEAQDGQNKQITEIVLEDMILLTSRNGMGGGDDYNEQSSSSNERSSLADEDVTPQKSQATSEPKTEEVKPEDEVAEPPKPESKPVKEEVKDEELDDLPF